MVSAANDSIAADLTDDIAFRVPVMIYPVVNINVLTNDLLLEQAVEKVKEKAGEEFMHMIGKARELKAAQEAAARRIM